MNILITVIIGLVVGLLARLAMPGRDPMGFVWTTLLGIAGAFLGAWVGQIFGFYSPGEPSGFLMSVAGALIILFVSRQIRRTRLQ